MRGRSYLLVAIAVCWLATTATAHAGTQQPDECNDPKALAKSRGRAVLELDGTRVDIPSWKTTITLDLPTSWPPAKRLVADQGSGAHPCMHELDYWTIGPAEVTSSIAVKDQTITYTLTGKEDLFEPREDRRQDPSDFQNRIGPWRVTADKDKRLVISFQTEEYSALRSMPWESLTVKADGFKLTSAQPFPVTQDKDTMMLWEEVSGARSTDPEPQLVQVLAFPEPMVSMKLQISQRAGSFVFLPYRGYLLALLIGIIVLLYIERRRRIGRSPKLLIDIALLAVVGATINGLDLIGHFVGRPISQYGPISILIIAWAAALIGEAPSSRPRRLLTVLLTTALAVIAIRLAPSRSSLDGDSNDVITSTLGITCAIYLVWLLFLGAVRTILSVSPFNWSKKLSRYSLALVLTVIYVAIYAPSGITEPLSRADLIYIIEIVQDSIPLLLILGAVGLLLLHAQDTRLLLDRYQTWVVAWLISVALLLVSPRYYLGLHVPIVAMAGLFTTMLVLRIAGQRAILARIVYPEKSSQDSTKSLQGSGQQLVIAGERLNSLSAELKALQKQLSEGNISSGEYSSRRSDLEAEADSLRRLPPTMQSKLIVPSTRHGEPLPERINPIDVALSLGPKADIAKTGMRAGAIALLLGLLPALYFTAQSWPLRVFQLVITSPDLFPLITFARQLFFWWLPGFVLGATWSSLYGRRGSTRAFQIWFCVALPLGLHSALNWGLDQQSEAAILFRVTLLLVILLVVGSAMDLQTLRGYELSHQWGLGLFRRYYNFNRLVATITLIIPLLTAGLSLWQQIQSGALRERPPPTRTERPAEQQSEQASRRSEQ